MSYAYAYRKVRPAQAELGAKPAASKASASLRHASKAVLGALQELDATSHPNARYAAKALRRAAQEIETADLELDQVLDRVR